MKRVIIPVAAFIAGMAIVPSVFADIEGGAPAPLDQWGNASAGLAKCLAGTEDTTCTLDKDITTETTTGYYAKVTKNMVLDLGGHTLTINTDYAGANLIEVADEASLTITNGSIVNNDTDGGKIKVGKKATLVINADVKDSITAEDAEGAKIVLAAGHILEGDLTVEGAEATTSAFGPAAATVEINGRMTGAYSQKNYVNGTISGSVSNAGNAVKAEGGALTLNGARISATEGGSAVVLAGEGGSLVVKGCSEVASANNAALFINGGANVASLTINNSTLKSTNNSTIQGEGKIDTVVIDGSRFEAKADAKVKVGTTTFAHATYDGRALVDGENVLTTATGSYGVETVVCDAPAAEEGEDKGEEAENPNTADTIATYLTIATVALLSLGATAFVAKKSNR